MSTISVSVGIVVFNTILDNIVDMAYKFRKYRNNTDLQAEIASTSFKVQLLNTALCPLVASFISMNYLGTTG